jgi:hypothetical protein
VYVCVCGSTQQGYLGATKTQTRHRKHEVRCEDGAGGKRKYQTDARRGYDRGKGGGGGERERWKWESRGVECLGEEEKRGADGEWPADYVMDEGGQSRK